MPSPSTLPFICHCGSLLKSLIHFPLFLKHEISNRLPLVISFQLIIYDSSATPTIYCRSDAKYKAKALSISPILVSLNCDHAISKSPILIALQVQKCFSLLLISCIKSTIVRPTFPKLHLFAFVFQLWTACSTYMITYSSA